MNAIYEKLAELEKRVKMYEEENKQLRTENAILHDDLSIMRKRAEVGEATENFFKEIKRIMR